MSKKIEAGSGHKKIQRVEFLGDVSDIFNPDGSINHGTHNTAGLHAALQGWITAEKNPDGSYKVVVTPAGEENIKKGLSLAGSVEKKERAYNKLDVLLAHLGFIDRYKIIKKKIRDYEFRVFAKHNPMLVTVALGGDLKEVRKKLEELEKVFAMLKSLGYEDFYVINELKRGGYELVIYKDAEYERQLKKIHGTPAVIWRTLWEWKHEEHEHD